MERHHNDALSRHKQQSWYIAGVILQNTGQNVYVIQIGNNKTVKRDCTQYLSREADPHGRAVTFDFTAEAFDSNTDAEEDDETGPNGQEQRS